MNDKEEEIWLKMLQRLNYEEISAFVLRRKNAPEFKEMLELGLVKAVDIGSTKLIDFFHDLKVDVNCVCIYKGIKVTPLLQSIAINKPELAKYLMFHKSNIHLKGEYGDALVTALHYDSPASLVTLILEKGGSLASRHSNWPLLNLREYCIQFNKIKAKSAIDDFIFKLIANGEFNKLKDLSEKGYAAINVTNRFRKTSRELAIERNHVNIVKLIDRIEEKQRRLKTKMNY